MTRIDAARDASRRLSEAEVAVLKLSDAKRRDAALAANGNAQAHLADTLDMKK